jgi:hypothetical protein
MDVFVFVIIVVFIGCASGVANNMLKNQRELREVNGDEGVLAEVDELRARIEVLEKIVTDEKYQLARELNQLEKPV